MLPISLKENVKVSYIDSLFTATTSLCVTGLVSVKNGIAYTYSDFGKVYIAILMQIGGLGVITFALIFIVLINKRISISQQSLIKESFNLTSFADIKKIFKKIVLISLIIELIGAILVFIDFYFIYHMNFSTALRFSLFHSIASFNNSGIDIIGKCSLMDFKDDIFLNIVTSLLIISGGFGYFVLIDLLNKKFKFKKLMLQSKIVITYSLALIIIGGISIYLLELNNEKLSIMNSLFLSVSSRTAGFSVSNLSNYRHSTLIAIMVLMFIGASSGSAGGGIKTTTLAVFLAYFRSLLTNKKPNLFKRSIKDDTIKRAFIIILLGLFLFILGTFLILLIEGDQIYLLNEKRINTYQENCTIYTSIDFAFETISAFATVGLSTGFTPYFKDSSKIILIALMFIGRVGIITIAMSFRSKNRVLYSYVEEDIAIG